MCLDHDKLKIKSSCIESKHDELVDKLNCESRRSMFGQQEEKKLGVEGIIEKIDENFELELTVERHEEEHGNGLEFDEKKTKSVNQS